MQTSVWLFSIIQVAQVTGEGGKSFAFVTGNALMIGGSNAIDKKRFVDIHSTTDWINDFEHSTLP